MENGPFEDVFLFPITNGIFQPAMLGNTRGYHVFGWTRNTSWLWLVQYIPTRHHDSTSWCEGCFFFSEVHGAGGIKIKSRSKIGKDLELCPGFQAHLSQVLPFYMCDFCWHLRQFSRLAVEFERGYLGDDGNAKTLHIGTLDFHVSNENRTWFFRGLVGDEILASCVGIIS